MSDAEDDWDNFDEESSSEEEDPDMAEDWSKEVDQIKADDGVVSIRAIKPGVIRAGAEPTTDQVGKLEIGEVFSILEEREIDGKKRVRMERGWVSLTSKKGTPLCVSEVAVQKLLSSVPILQELSERDRAGLASLLEGQEFQDQEVIMQEGDPGNDMYFLEQGEAAAKKGNKVVRLYSSGDYFGELALLTGFPRQATVVARGKDGARCLKLSRANFDKYASTCKAVMAQRAAYATDSDSSEYSSDSTDDGPESSSTTSSDDDDSDGGMTIPKFVVVSAAEERAAKLKADQERRRVEREALTQKREEEAAARQKQQAELAARRKAEREEREAKAQAERQERVALAAKRREEQAKEREEEAAARQKRQAKAAAAAKKAADEKAKAKAEAKAQAERQEREAKRREEQAKERGEEAAARQKRQAEAAAAAKKAADEKAKAKAEAKKAADEKAKTEAEAAAAAKKAADEQAIAVPKRPEPEPETEPVALKAKQVEQAEHASFASPSATSVQRESTPPASPWSIVAPRTTSATRLMELDERLDSLKREAEERRQARLQLDEERLNLSAQRLFLSPGRERLSATAADEAEFDMDGLTTDGKNDELQKAEQELRSTCASYWCYVLSRLAAIIVFSGLFSLLPVMFQFGDPYDVTQAGVRNNIGYFLGCNVVSWGAFFLTLSLWMHRILAVRLHALGTVVLPTLCAVAIFAGGTVLLGAPIPLATLTLGAPCLLVSLAALRCFMSPKNEGGQAAIGGHLLRAFTFWSGQMLVYTVLTIAMIFDWPHDVLISIVFALGLEVIGLAGGESTLFASENDGSSDQRNCARLLVVLPLSLHVSFTQFLFPVLGSTDSVVCNAVTSAIMNVYVLRGGLPTLRAGSFRGGAAAQSYAIFLSRRFICHLVQLVCPVLFMIVLAFNAWGPNAGMFHILSVEELQDKNGEDGITKVFLACAVNLGSSLLSAGLSILVVWGWLDRNSQVAHDEAEISHAIPDSDDMDNDDDMAGVDNSRSTCLQALQIAKEHTVIALTHNSHFVSALRGTYPAQDGAPPYAVVRGKEEEADEETGDGAAADDEPIATEDPTGQLDLIVASLACCTAMCSVCMLMKHNGMALEGWFEWARGNDMPYALCPGFSFESPCLARNASLHLWDLP